MSSSTQTRYSIRLTTRVQAPRSKAWDLLVDPEKLSGLFWGSTVESDFRVGSPIVWKGSWQGKPFEDRGTVKKRKDGKLIQLSHWTPSLGTPEQDESGHNILTFQLDDDGDGVQVTFLHENIATPEMKEHSEKNWVQLLQRMKEMLET